MDFVVAFVVVLFLPPVSSDPFYLTVSDAEFATLEECVAAMPAVIADEFAHVGNAIDGAACVTTALADAIGDARSAMYR